METSQGNSLCYFKLAKMHHIFLFIFYLFPSTKSDNRRVEQVLLGVRDGTDGRREVAWKGIGR
jgi:hypothetical protein